MSVRAIRAASDLNRVRVKHPHPPVADAPATLSHFVGEGLKPAARKRPLYREAGEGGAQRDALGG